MKYGILIKSHSAFPDYTDVVEAEDREKAVDHFYSFLKKFGYTRDEVDSYIVEE